MKTLKLKKIVAVAVAAVGLAAVAEPKVEITHVDVGNARDGVFAYTYNVSGVESGTCTIDVKITADKGNKTKTATISAGNETGCYAVDTKNDPAFGKVYTDVAVTLSIAGSGSGSGDDSGLGGVQLWKDGPYWAQCNIGASSPWDSGYYFWWGDTVGYKRNADDSGWVSSKDGTTSIQFSSSDDKAGQTYEKDNEALMTMGWIDSKGNLSKWCDAATANLGAPWRMPTSDEIQGLVENCTTTWTNFYGVSGRLVKGKTTGYTDKSIFLPAAGDGSGDSLSSSGSFGFYWSSTPNSADSRNAWFLNFTSSYIYRYNYGGRYGGRSVRAVRGFAK